jgi:hypothetical protein
MKYEYRIIDHDVFDESEKTLINNMGKKGWEIIRILDPIKYIDSEGFFIRIYYRMEIPTPIYYED